MPRPLTSRASGPAPCFSRMVSFGVFRPSVAPLGPCTPVPGNRLSLRPAFLGLGCWGHRAGPFLLKRFLGSPTSGE